MLHPNQLVKGNPNEQLKERINKFSKDFQQEGSINCILVMPYTSHEKLGIDLKLAADDLRLAITDKASGFICQLSFPYDKNGKLSMSLLFAIVSKDPSSMSADNHKEWMKEINFGKARY